jgi:hypothetical protein
MLGLDGKPECGLRVSKQKDRPKAAFSEVMGRGTYAALNAVCCLRR